MLILPTSSSASLFSLALTLSFASAQLKCYWPDGTEAAPSAGHTVCNPLAAASPCCQGGSTCLTNGLCFLEYDSSLNTGSCTDSTWGDPTCFQACKIARINFQSTIYRCSDNNWCCSAGGNTTNCCPTETLFKLPSTFAQVQNGTNFIAGYTIALLASLVSGTSSGTPSATTGANTSTCQPAQTTSTLIQCSNSATIGVGVGLGLALLLTLATTLYLLLREKKKNKNLRAVELGNNPPAVGRSEIKTAKQQPPQVGELSGSHFGPGRRPELEATQLRDR